MSKGETPLYELVELGYFRKLPTFRAAKRWSCAGCAIAAAVWVLFAFARKDHELFASGSMSVGHEMYADQCSKCHTESWRGLGLLMNAPESDQSMNQACIECHGPSIGHEPDVFAARHWTTNGTAHEKERMGCHLCHSEHNGPGRLNRVEDERCTGCHANLKSLVSESLFRSPITDFVKNHVDFRVWELPPKERDPGTVDLNHVVHLKEDLLGPDGRPAKLDCADCHRAGPSVLPWRFGAPRLHEDSRQAVTDAEPHLQSAYMDPIRYSLHCQKCHELVVDPLERRLNGRSTVPHESPAAIRTTLEGQLLRAIRERPGLLHGSVPEGQRARQSLRRPIPEPVEKRMLQWVDDETKRLAAILYRENGVCAECHSLTIREGEGTLPKIIEPRIKPRWFAHASFTHERHRVVPCLDCHAGVTASKETSDLLLPHIDTCGKCHDSTSWFGSGGGAPSDCVTCHTYHRPPSSQDQFTGHPIDRVTAE